MRTYTTLENLKQAAFLGIVVAGLAIPRIVIAGLDPWVLVPAAFVAMTLVSGAATAWGHCAGMHGLFPGRWRQLAGVGVAVLAAAALLPFYVLTAPVCREAMAQSLEPRLVALHYPGSTADRLALVMWAAGFELMFFVAAPVAFFARLTRRQWAAVALTVGFRVGVTLYRLSGAGVTGAFVPLVGLTALPTLCGALLVARAGLPAAAVFTAVLHLHLLLTCR